jgi:hypothetical protein
LVSQFLFGYSSTNLSYSLQVLKTSHHFFNILHTQPLQMTLSKNTHIYRSFNSFSNIWNNTLANSKSFSSGKETICNAQPSWNHSYMLSCI